MQATPPRQLRKVFASLSEQIRGRWLSMQALVVSGPAHFMTSAESTCTRSGVSARRVFPSSPLT